jgi:hypothetical protein
MVPFLAHAGAESRGGPAGQTTGSDVAAPSRSTVDCEKSRPGMTQTIVDKKIDLARKGIFIVNLADRIEFNS